MTHLEKLQKNFINLRFGTFIHFNSATFQFNTGNIEDWEYGCENFGQDRKYPFDERLWNPTELDTDMWAKCAASAGCRFAALTTKHHEGFALWNTEYSTHSVGSSDNKTDVVAKYLESFRKEGIVAGLYFSILDLTHGIGRGRGFDDEKKQFIKNQIKELLTNYGDIPFLMVDGWNSPWGGPSYEELPFEELSEYVKKINPDCLLMNIGCNDSIEHTDIIFYENAAGQEVDDNFSGPGVSCNKFTKTWFWRQSDTADTLASAAWAWEKARGCFAKNVNFMLNISPDVRGKIDENQMKAFEKMGALVEFPQELIALPEKWLRRR